MMPGQKGVITHRSICNLTPNGVLANDFYTGKKKLIPMVHVHGIMAAAAEHTAVPM